MQTYIALLRGINVGGKKKIKMVDLKMHLKEERFEQIETYIQSGNIVFKTIDGSCSAFAKVIQEKIMSVYGFEILVIVLKIENLEKILSNCPFVGEAREQSYFTIFHSVPEAVVIKKVNDLVLKNEQFKVTQHCVYLYPSNGYGRAKGNNNFFEKKLKVAATTRNYKTIKRLMEMVG